MTRVNRPNVDRDLKLVAAVATAVSLLSFLYYFQRGEILLYGDAVAHINIARRVFDSQTPGLLQLGTVWLPLPHLLMIPFLVSDWMWRSGVGGSIPSMVAYVLCVMGIFRLARDMFADHEGTRRRGRLAAWVAALVYGGNPNIIYLQTTTMTEPLYLAFFIWTVVYVADFSRAVRSSTPGLTDKNAAARPLSRCALCLAGAELTRYDGWFLAAVIGAVVFFLLLRKWNDQAFRRLALKFLVAIALAPLLWLAYNAAVYGNPLEFANGPYSAKAIEQRTARPGYPAHPGAGNVVMATSFFLKAAQLNMARGNWGRLWLAIALAGLFLVFRLRASRVVLLLWTPVVFYALSIAYSGIPLFLPTWWPFTWYNLRYGLQFLPLFAVSAALIVLAPIATAAPEGAIEERRLMPSLKRWPDTNQVLRGVPAVVLAIVGLSYVFVWRAGPLCFKEAWVNSRTKLTLESSVAKAVSTLPVNSTYLMYIGDHVGVFQQAGLPLRQVINEGNHRPWKKPADTEGLWEQALADPAGNVDFVIAYEGDAVDQAVQKANLTLITEIHTTGQPRARIYAARAGRNPSH
ncbi:MAG: hypothetical protein DMG80_13875 [Acidobacteria bacterium]|nr:MAG: hypothetical protein DMG80_13875 [Acidobacteriota bacterium]